MNSYILNTSRSAVAVSAGTTVYEYTGDTHGAVAERAGKFADKPSVAVTLEPGSSDYFMVPASYLSPAGRQAY